MGETISIRMWLISLAVFAVVISVSSSITQGDVTLGIIDHQAAGTAARVDEIQAQWQEGGVRNLAIVAMVGDLAWIWMYALGAYLVGKGFATKRQGMLRIIGLAVAVSAAVFGMADYAETISQFIQLLQDTGSDTFAGFAALMQPVKIGAFIWTFFGIILALVLDRFAQRPVA